MRIFLKKQNQELEGKVSIAGTDVRDWDTGELNTRIGYVFQNPFTQISGIKETVFEEVAMGLENLGIPKKQMVDEVLRVLELLGITHLMEKNPNVCLHSGHEFRYPGH